MWVRSSVNSDQSSWEAWVPKLSRPDSVSGFFSAVHKLHSISEYNSLFDSR